MQNKIIYCGECEKFEYDDIDGSGKCFYGAKCHCDDLCHLTHGKAMSTYDFDLCDNENCPKKQECERYKIYKQGVWKHCYVMHGCIDCQLFKQVIQ